MSKCQSQSVAKAKALKSILLFVSPVLVAAIVYAGSIFYSRWRRVRDSEQRAGRAEAGEARKTLDLLGGDRLHIMSFYATPGVIRPCDRASLRYGVNGADKVRIELRIEDIKPALSRCLQVTPRSDTEYRLIAEDNEGHSVSESFVLKVAT